MRNLTISAMLLAIFAGFAMAVDTPAPTPADTSVPVIGILPFNNLAPDPEFVTPVPPNKASDMAAVAFNTTNWIGYGLPEFVLVKLTMGNTTGVVQSYVMNIAAKKLNKEYLSELENDTETIGKMDDLVGTKWIVKGEYQKKGDMLEVKIHLIDPDDTNATKGPFEFKRKINEFFDLASDIAIKIMSEVGAPVDPANQAVVMAHETDNFLAARWLGEGCRTYATGQRISNFQLALDADPKFTEARLLLADSYRLDGQSQRALPEYAQILLEDTNLPGVKWGLALATKATVMEALDKIQKENNPNTPGLDDKTKVQVKAQLDKAIAELYSKGFVDVIKLLEENLAAHPLFMPDYEDLIRLNLDMGNKLKQTSNFDKAIAVADGGIKLFPQYYLLYELEGQAYWYRGINGKSWQTDYKTAIDVFKKCLAMNANNPRIHYNLGSLYYNLKMANETIAEWELFMQLDPSFSKKDDLQKTIAEIKAKGLK